MFLKTTAPHPTYFSYGDHLPGVLPTSVLTKFTGSMFPFWFDKCRITWFPDPAWRSPVFNVYRSGSNEGPWSKLTPIPTSETVFNDFNTQIASKYAHDLYKVEVIERGVSLGFSNIIKNEREMSTWHQLRAEEINRREWLMLSRFIGVDTIVLKHVSYGKYNFRCSDCWDAVNKVVRKDYCTTCYGTSYEKGYYAGIHTKFQYVEPNKEDVVTEEGRMEPANTTAWTIAYPELDINDLLIRTDDFRIFRIDSVQNTSLVTQTVRQMVNLTHIPYTAVEYELLKREGVLPE